MSKKPVTLTQAKHTAIVNATLAGLTRRLSAQAAEIGDSTLYEWLAKGREELDKGIDSAHSRLVKDMCKAETDNAARLLRIVEDAAIVDPKNWKAAWSILSHRYKNDYGRTVEIHNHHSGSLDIASQAACDDRIKEIMRK
jgi:hypothetical protein